MTVGYESKFELEELRTKVRDAFGDLVIDKRRLPASKLTARGIPAYVGEWVLSSIVPGDGPLSIDDGRKVLDWAREKMPTTEEAPVVRLRLSSGQVLRVLTSVEAEVVLHKDKEADTRAVFPLLGIRDAQILQSTMHDYPDLLKQGMWGIATIEGGPGVYLADFKPMQATIDVELFKAARAKFTTTEWIHLLIDSMGLDATSMTPQQHLYALSRLLPLTQQSMHLMELAPKGTGKSYLYENISPRVRLISSGSVSPAVLFVNNASGQWGLLARFKVVVLDEVQTLKLGHSSEIVGGLKGYLANGKITRGGKYETGSDCSLVLLANIPLNEDLMPLGDSLVQELPREFHESALLDRFRGIVPGWKLPKLNTKSFSSGLGMKSDFFGEVLCGLRDELSYDQAVTSRVRLSGSAPYHRNQEAVRAIASGYLKLLFPHEVYNRSELEDLCVLPALEYRQNIWNELRARDKEYLKFDELLRADVV
ncbi:MAG: BREX system Lon protease-like protein BrxL [Fimbriimonadaceae bacterium]|nr:BREX system Lon protease-like protein BrxL [Fimbriimonadaceae bacterium]